jgi:RNA polymerase sigma-70 factor, ECF subfamily
VCAESLDAGAELAHHAIERRLRASVRIAVPMGSRHSGVVDAGTHNEFTAVARKELPRLYSLARRLVAADAEDLVQECLLKAYTHYDGLRDDNAVEAWLRTILLNCARDRYRRRTHRVDEEPIDDVEDFSLYRQIADEDPFPYSDSLHVEFLCRFGPEDVWAVLRALPELYRVPLVLVHMEDMATKQAARLLGVPLGTLLARLHRGRKLFERSLWEYAVRHDLLKDPAVAARGRP